MGSLHKKAKKGLAGSIVRGIVGEKTFDDFHPLGTQYEQQYDATKAAEQAAKDVANQKAIPLADEDALERERRRRNSGRRGGRASTVLTDDDRLGG